MDNLIGSDWTNPERQKATKRATAFMASGLPKNESELLAVRLMYRDRPDYNDDRRVCFECQKMKGCKLLGPNNYTLDDDRYTPRRCPAFALIGSGACDWRN